MYNYFKNFYIKIKQYTLGVLCMVEQLNNNNSK